MYSSADVWTLWLLSTVLCMCPIYFTFSVTWPQLKYLNIRNVVINQQSLLSGSLICGKTVSFGLHVYRLYTIIYIVIGNWQTNNTPTLFFPEKCGFSDLACLILQILGNQNFKSISSSCFFRFIIKIVHTRELCGPETPIALNRLKIDTHIFWYSLLLFIRFKCSKVHVKQTQWEMYKKSTKYRPIRIYGRTDNELTFYT